MKPYSAPQLTEYGDIAELTAIFGGAFTGDVLVDLNGDVVQDGPPLHRRLPDAHPSNGECITNQP